MSLRGSTMPRPIPVPLRQAMFRLWQQGQRTGQIAAALGLPCSTIRRLLGRFRRDGRDGIVPDYHRPSAVAATPPDVARAALRVRREHPTWGAGLIRVHLLQGMPGQAVPSVRTLQRWFERADLSPAPAGRRPQVERDRSTRPHETWQMDAKEPIRIRTGDEVSWLRLIDECSGTVLGTAVFPPGDLEPRPSLGRARAAAPGLWPLGAAGPLPRRQRYPLGIMGRLPHRPVARADRPEGRRALEQSEESPGERGRRALPGDIRPLVRAVDLRDARGTAGGTGADGPAVPRDLPLPGASQPDGILPGAGAHGPALRRGPGGGAGGLVARGRAPLDLCGGAARGPVGEGVVIQPGPLRRLSP